MMPNPPTNERPEKEQKDSDSIYLSQLTFDPAKANKFLNFLLTNVRVIALFIIGILLWGFYSFNVLPLESMPEVKIPYAIVSVSLPGASPSDVEELVVKKIENKIANLSGVKTMSATAMNSFASVRVEFRAEEDLKEAIRRLRDAVANLKADLPSDASEPVVSEVAISNSPVWTMVMTGPYDNFALRRYAQDLKDEFLKLPGTSEVNISGGDETEIRVTYDPQKLDLYGLSMDQINAVVKANNITLPLGTINVGNFEYTLRLDGKFKNVAELRDLPVGTFGTSVIYLKDVADVVERAAERKSTTHFSIAGGQPQNAVSISLVKKTGFSIVELIDQGKVKIETLKKDHFPADLYVETTYDMSDTIREDFNNLSHEALNTIILVTIILFLFVGLKEAFTAGIVIPLVFASTFGLMAAAGQTLNFLSLFSLILSLGLLVDDAIVVVQATKQYMSTGKFTPEEAVLLVFKDFFAIILTTSLTTIFAFLPLVLATGIIGQFIRAIPITTSLTLAASTIIAITINHPMAAILERFRMTRKSFKIAIIIFIALFVWSLLSAIQGSVIAIVLTAIFLFLIISLLLAYRRALKQYFLENERHLLEEQALPEKIREKLQHHYAPETQKNWWVKATSGLVKLEKIMPSYERLLNSFLKNKIRSYLLIVVLIIIFLGSLLLPATGILKSEFLAASDQDLMYLSIEGPPGLLLEDTQKIADQVQQILLEEKQLKNFSVTVGAAGVSLKGGGLTGGGAGSGGQTNKAQFAINLLPENERPVKQKSYVYAQELRKKLAGIKGATITLEELSGGPPSGSDFEVRFSGEDLVKLEQLANQYKGYLADIPGTVNIKTSLSLSPGEFTIKLKPQEMQLRSITPAQLAGTLRTAVSGGDLAKIIEGEDEIQIKAEYAENSVNSLDALKSLPLINSKGQKFQFSEVAEISLGSSLTSISRMDQKRVVVLSASVVKPVLPGEVLAKFQKILNEKPLPQGYTAIFGGQADTNTESIYSIFRAMIVAFILIISILVIQFNSFRKAMLALMTIPLAMSGVFFGLTLAGFTLSFPTLIGILALFGIVVKNAIILIDKINLNLRVGIPFQESIIDASKSRLEAIFLTSTATIIGMLPITFYDETWQGLGGGSHFWPLHLHRSDPALDPRSVQSDLRQNRRP